MTQLYSRVDHERVIKLLLAALHQTASAFDDSALLRYDEDVAGNPVVTFTAAQLGLTADRYRLDVTTRPPPGATLELRLRDDGWDDR